MMSKDVSNLLGKRSNPNNENDGERVIKRAMREVSLSDSSFSKPAQDSNPSNNNNIRQPFTDITNYQIQSISGYPQLAAFCAQLHKSSSDESSNTNASSSNSITLVFPSSSSPNLTEGIENEASENPLPVNTINENELSSPSLQMLDPLESRVGNQLRNADDESLHANAEATFLELTPMQQDLRMKQTPLTADVHRIDRFRKWRLPESYWLESSADDLMEKVSLAGPLLNELKYRPDPAYFTTVQNDIPSSMRMVLVGWLIEVGEEYSLAEQTLLLALSYLDRFLSKKAVNRQYLQLIGATSLMIASKFWEIRPLTPNEMVYISANSFQKEAVIAMERTILTTLNFSLNVVTPFEITERCIATMRCTRRCAALANMLVDLLSLHSSYIRYQPSSIACSALLLAIYTIGHLAIAAPSTSRVERLHVPALSRRLSQIGTPPLLPRQNIIIPNAADMVSTESFPNLSDWLAHFTSIVNVNISDCTHCINEMYGLYDAYFSPSGRLAFASNTQGTVDDPRPNALIGLFAKYNKDEYGFVARILPRRFPS